MRGSPYWESRSPDVSEDAVERIATRGDTGTLGEGGGNPLVGSLNVSGDNVESEDVLGAESSACFKSCSTSARRVEDC